MKSRIYFNEEGDLVEIPYTEDEIRALEQPRGKLIATIGDLPDGRVLVVRFKG